MIDFILMTDSCIDLSQELADSLDLVVLPLTYTIEGKTYSNYLDEREMSITDFYDTLRDGKVSITSQLNPDQFMQEFKKYLQKDKDILFVSFSSALSGTYNSALIARDMLAEEGLLNGNKVEIVDSLCASMGQGLLLTYAANLKKEGKSLFEVKDWVLKNRLSISHLFTVGDLNHLRRGGRLSYAKAFLGTILRIKPLLHVDEEGRLVQTGAARGRKTSLKKMLERMNETISDPENQIIYISHGDCIEDAEQIKAEILATLNVKEVVINHVGPVIGSHSGVDTLAIFYIGTDRLHT